MTQLILTNAKIVTPTEIIHGTLTVNHGKITDVEPGNSSCSTAIDFEGDYLIPGLIEMHTDNMEKNLEPRPGVKWPSPMAAVLAHDAQIASSGITTVLDAISIGEAHKKGRDAFLDASIKGIEDGLKNNILRADHKIHLRCEVVGSNVLEMFEPHAENPLVILVSLMDHTPGQRQWRKIEHWLTYNKESHLPKDIIEQKLSTLIEAREQYGDLHRREIVSICRERGLIIATHDDTEVSHVDEAAADGAAISEFPTTIAAAQRAHELGLKTIMGSPNVVRGGSHSGNVSAAKLAKLGLLDGLSSDYVPASLLHAGFLLHEDIGLDLHDAIKIISANTADMIGLHDRGRIEVGLRGDLVRVKHLDHLPIVRQVWREGQQVA